MSFADATVGSSRLQALLREIGIDDVAGNDEKVRQIGVMVLAD